MFRAPLRKQWNASLFCQKSCRLHHRAEANRRYRARKKTTAERVAENRERNRVWAATHRSCRRARPWLLGEPPFGERLTCHLLRMTMYPKPTSWRFAHENMRHLHGMVSAILGDMVGIEHKMDFVAFRRQSAFNIHISGDALPFGVGGRTRIKANASAEAKGDVEQDVRDQLVALWDAFCADESAWPARDESESASV